MKDKLQHWRKVFVRLVKDLGIPAAFAVCITMYQSLDSGKSVLAILGSFFTTLFFCAAYFSYVQRARKVVVDEENHNDVVSKQNQVIERLEGLAGDLSNRQEMLVTQLEKLADDLSGHVTGGKGFCYVWFTQIDSMCIRELNVMLHGDYSMQETRIEVVNFESIAKLISIYGTTLPLDMLQKRDFVQIVGTILPNVSYLITSNIAFEDPRRIRLHIHWQAKNGVWYQRLQLEHLEGRWLFATFVQRGDKKVFVTADEGYPLDAEGSPIFHEFEDELLRT